jgi:hypothetical protein
MEFRQLTSELGKIPWSRGTGVDHRWSFYPLHDQIAPVIAQLDYFWCRIPM